jgi:hypothetical protein
MKLLVVFYQHISFDAQWRTRFETHQRVQVGIDSLEIHDLGISHIWKAPLVAGGEWRKVSSWK